MLILYGLVLLGLGMVLFLSRNWEASKECKYFRQSGKMISDCCGRMHLHISPRTASCLLLILLLGNSLGILLSWKDQMAVKEITELSRNEDEEYELTVEGKREDGSIQEFTFDIPEKSYSKKQIRKWFDQTEKKLPDLILGENKSLDHVEYPLQLVENISGLPVEISWTSEDSQIIDWEGELGDAISKEGESVELYAQITCQEESRDFSILVKAYPISATDGGGWLQAVKDSFYTLNKDTKKEKLYFPDKVLGEEISWYLPSENRGSQMMLLLLLFTVVLLLWKRQESDNEKKERMDRLLMDYPELIQKFTLLLNAGLNSRRTVARIAVDYHNRKKEGGEKFVKRPAFEEMERIYWEMEQGISEETAYENFGMRCGLSMYRNFSTLLIQNLRKGNSEILQLLEREAVEAGENRKRRARVLGEKAGTKLLFPMILMLMIVFVIVLFPAWTSFSL